MTRPGVTQMTKERGESTGTPRWLSYTLAFVQLLYVSLTFFMLMGLNASNKLTRKAQELTLRPSLVIEEQLNQIAFNRPGTPQESWFVTTGVANRGSLPAFDVGVNAWIDGRSDNHEITLPNNDRTVIPPSGAAVFPVETTKQDVLAKLSQGGCFLHVNAYYRNEDKKAFKTVATYALVYVEGKTSQWLAIRLDQN